MICKTSIEESDAGFNPMVEIIHMKEFCTKCPAHSLRNRVLKYLLSSTVLTEPISALSSSRPGFNGSLSSGYGLDDLRNLLPHTCGFPGDPKQIYAIAGGTPTDPSDYPWMAGLEYNTPKGREVGCGGSLITNRHVLTAAHCVNPLHQPGWYLISVRLGDWDTSAEFDACDPDGKCKPRHIDVPIKREFRHELYFRNRSYVANDIALLELAETVEFNEEIRPICLPVKPDLPARMTVIGWGITEYKLKSKILLEVNVPLFDQQRCESVYKRFGFSGLSSSQICAGGEKYKDSCTGDSGGTLIGHNEETIWERSFEYPRAVMGIVTLGSRLCGTPGIPAVYTKVYDYEPWILSKIRLSNGDANS
ncbi:hypothetical protein QAD02_010124 [Eretmocerus hayati]|uniref:Uncharacterized protein n=1 Tax=Eretmocerus hayati TaxID=131215 RepID=A0ACC2NC17_9HYME|nr:hypothetical protein QAD02_010124 [Eretmocerus hayati]